LYASPEISATVLALNCVKLKLIASIGKGGMGEVWKAHDPRFPFGALSFAAGIR